MWPCNPATTLNTIIPLIYCLLLFDVCSPNSTTVWMIRRNFLWSCSYFFTHKVCLTMPLSVCFKMLLYDLFSVCVQEVKNAFLLFQHLIHFSRNSFLVLKFLLESVFSLLLFVWGRANNEAKLAGISRFLRDYFLKNLLSFEMFETCCCLAALCIKMRVF